jgi:hypothetical protein
VWLEFPDQATADKVTVMRPDERDEDEVRRAVAKLGVAVGQVLEETGMTEEELAKVFDLRQPMPE